MCPGLPDQSEGPRSGPGPERAKRSEVRSGVPADLVMERREVGTQMQPCYISVMDIVADTQAPPVESNPSLEP